MWDTGDHLSITPDRANAAANRRSLFGTKLRSDASRRTPLHATLTLMPLAARSEVETQSPAAPRERPWLFNFLIAPDAVISLGLASGALTFLLRNEGVTPGRAASIAALIALPHAIYFFWGPITDFWMRRRTWLMIAAAAAAAAVLAAFHQHTLATSWAVRLLFLGACFGVVVAAACGGMMGALASETNKRRASSFYQSGSLAIGAVAVFLLLSFAERLKLGALGWIVAAMIVLPVALRIRHAAAIDGPRTRRVGNRSARRPRIQIHISALAGHSVCASYCCAVRQRSHDRPAAGAGPRLRSKWGASSVDQRSRRRVADHGRRTLGVADSRFACALRLHICWWGWPMQRHWRCSASDLSGLLFTSQARCFFSSPWAPAIRCSRRFLWNSSADRARAGARAIRSSTHSAMFRWCT